jgi:hypothetical protein
MRLHKRIAGFYLLAVLSLSFTGCKFDWKNEAARLHDFQQSAESAHEGLQVLATAKLLSPAFVDHYNKRIKPVLVSTIHSYAAILDLASHATDPAELKQYRAQVVALSATLTGLLLEIITAVRGIDVSATDHPDTVTTTLHTLDTMVNTLAE